MGPKDVGNAIGGFVGGAAKGVGNVVFGGGGSDDKDKQAEQDRQRQEQEDEDRRKEEDEEEEKKKKQDEEEEEKEKKEKEEEEQKSKDAAAASSAASVASSLSAQAASIASSASAQAASVASSISAQAASLSSVQAASSISAQAASFSSLQAQVSLQAHSQAVAVAASTIVAAPQQPAQVTVYATATQVPAIATATAVQQLNTVIAIPDQESAFVSAAPTEESAVFANASMQEQTVITANGSAVVRLGRRARQRRQDSGTMSVSLWRLVSTLGAFSTTTFAAPPSNMARSIDAAPQSHKTALVSNVLVENNSSESAMANVLNAPAQTWSRFPDNMVMPTTVPTPLDAHRAFELIGEAMGITTSDSIPSSPAEDAAPVGDDDPLISSENHDDGSNLQPTNISDEPTTLATVYRKRTPGPPKGKGKATSKAASSAPKVSTQASKQTSSGKAKASASNAAKAGSKASASKAPPAVSASASAAAKTPASASSPAAKGGIGGLLNKGNVDALVGGGRTAYSAYKEITITAAPAAAPEPSQASSAMDPSVTLDPNDDKMWAEDTVGVPPAEGDVKQGSGKSPSQSAGAGAPAAAESASPQGSVAAKVGGASPSGAAGSGGFKASNSPASKGSSAGSKGSSGAQGSSGST